MSELSVVTRSRLVADLRTLGVQAGDTVMLHASVRAIGWVVGGPDTVIQALLDVLTPAGTLTMLVGWEDGTYEMSEWPADKQQAYLDESPAFDPARSRAYRKWSILTEYLRTWPGAARSAHPDCSFTAVGRLAGWLTADHPLQYGHGPRSPLARLCQARGRVLLLGVGFGNLTLLHYAEHMAAVPGKQVVRYRAPLLVDGQRQWVELEEFDTCRLIGQWQGDGYFDLIPREALSCGIGRRGRVGAALAYLFPAEELHRFAVHWLEEHLGREPRDSRQSPEGGRAPA
ncbi:MAG: aminoglycoside 3-N-acetyltransferase [Candidatus Latescibacterota bacterium]